MFSAQETERFFKMQKQERNSYLMLRYLELVVIMLKVKL